MSKKSIKTEKDINKILYGDKEVEKAVLKKIKEAVEFREQQRDQEYITNMAHYEGLQWNLAENKQDSPFLLRSDINHLKNAVDKRLGSLFAESYYGELQPLSPNDVDAINVLNNLYRNEWSRLNADDRVEEALKQAAIQDNGYVEISFDTGAIYGGTGTRNEGSITLKTLSTSDVYLDPTADSIDTCGYIVVKSQKSKEWIRRNRPEWLDKISSKDIKPVDIEDGEEGNIYSGRYYSKSNQDMYKVNSVYEKYPYDHEMETTDPDTGKVTKETVTITKIRVHYVINDKLIATDDNYPFDEFSIIPLQWESIPQSPYGIPLVRGLTIPQKVANLIESAANNIAMHYSTPTWIVSSESGLDINKVAKLANALGMVWKVDGDVSKAIKQMEVPELNEQLIGIRNSFVGNIQAYSGVTDAYTGDIGTAGSTAQGTIDAINRATIIDNSPIKQIEKFVEKLSRMIIKFMVRYYKNQKIYIRDTQKDPNGDYTFKDFLMDPNYENINYDFTVKLSSRSKADKNRQYNLMKDLYQTQNQYKEDKRIINIPDLVKAAQLDNYDEMFKRFKDMSNEAYQEKADMIVQIMQIGQTITPNGTPLITAEQMQQGMIDVLDDNGDLSTVEQIFTTYEQYQAQLADLQARIVAQEQQAKINQVNQESDELMSMLQQGQKQIMDQERAQQEDNFLQSLGI